MERYSSLKFVMVANTNEFFFRTMVTFRFEILRNLSFKMKKRYLQIFPIFDFEGAMVQIAVQKSQTFKIYSNVLLPSIKPT